MTEALANAVVGQLSLPHWQAADIGATTQLTDGRLVWVFGDTVRSQEFQPRIVSNSMLVSAGKCASQLLPTGGGPVIPDLNARTVRWPMSAASWLLPDGTDELVVTCSRIRRGGTGQALDFTFLGTDVAVFNVAKGGVPQLLRITEATPDNPNTTQVNWGAASLVDGRWLYEYGTRRPSEQSFGRELYASRVSLTQVSDRTAWQFWDGHAWQPDVAKATATLPAQGGVSQTLSIDHIGHEYVAVSKRDGDLGDFVYTWHSTTPRGPWEPHAGVPAPNGVPDPSDLQYAPLGHPEIPVARGRLLVSISRNTTDLRRLLEQPEVGKPRFAEITLPP